MCIKVARYDFVTSSHLVIPNLSCDLILVTSLISHVLLCDNRIEPIHDCRFWIMLILIILIYTNTN